MADQVLKHYGTPRHSGRYPWGSGQQPFQSSKGFLGFVSGLEKQGLSQQDIAKAVGYETTTQLRAAKSIAKNEHRQAQVAQALRLKDKGMSNVAIGRQMGINESVVRTLLDPALADRRDSLQTTASLLRDKVTKDGPLDIGLGTANHLSISETKLNTAVAMLEHEGYEVRNIQVPQQTGKNKTTIKTLVPPGAPKFIDPNTIKTVAAYSEDGGKTYLGIEPPRNISSKRVVVRYAEDGGTNADGVIYVRPGVPDISLGASRYAQVRIAVDGTHYLKGMAMYKNDLPEGVDLMFNTNKTRAQAPGKLDAMKPLKGDEDNPFGSVVRQQHYTDEKGKKQLSAMNIVNEEGNWKDWSRSLSSQFLSKQSIDLARNQLDLTFKQKLDEFNEIKGLTNPVIKKNLLLKFADNADSSASHLKAHALPRQGTHVILPFEKMKENEIFAPNYPDGMKVALVRFPHGGTFEIPELTVNNRYPEAKKMFAGRPVPDAIGIHPKVAERLSGADFDGDTVLVIPNNRNTIKSTPALKQLEHFDPKDMYKPYDGMRTIDGGTWSATQRKALFPPGKKSSGGATQQQMGEVSNLITDMTLKGASNDEIARAVRHSMTVIDAEKHSLNVKQSYVDNGIADLKRKYQGVGSTGRLAGASTIISRAGSRTYVPERKARRAARGGPIDPLTGEKVYEPTGGTKLVRKTSARTGLVKEEVVAKTTRSTKLAEAKDAHALSSGLPIENVYATHANKLKAMANDARKEALGTGRLKYSPTANKTYASQVKSLNAKLDLALKNKPLERQAQIIAKAVVDAKVRDNPGMDDDTRNKVKGQALTAARDRVGLEKRKDRLIDISDDEWKAIQAGAISTNKLSDILDNANIDKVKALATPRTAYVMTPVKLARAKAMLDSGYNQAEIAEALGVPTSTLNTALGREGA